MSAPSVHTPASGSRLVKAGSDAALIGQPPEVLKGLLLNRIEGFNTLVLTDTREKDGSLTNNLEFPIYFFLFVMQGLQSGQKINLVGETRDISHALKLLRITLLGPTRHELDAWDTDRKLKEEWLQVADAIALKNQQGETILVEDFFNVRPFVEGVAKLDQMTIQHDGIDQYTVSNDAGSVSVDLNEDTRIAPCYSVQSDYVPGGLVKMGLEVLGGASGFTPDEPCTGLALCFNGEYILIDCIPFLDEHLFARGISKNQVTALFLTHLHDDHCAMFPLMLMPHRVEVITTREIFNMAMEKLACGLGWEAEVVREHFKLVEIQPGRPLNYFGLNILPHVTVHSIPTVGATFSMMHRGYERQICIVGDNHTMAAVRDLNDKGIVRKQTLETLLSLYRDPFSLLVADGGAGAIHGDPADALNSKADRVVFVHVEELPNEFDTTFSLASSGKRYTVIEGDPSLYTSQVNHYLCYWLGEMFPNRWMRSLLAEEEIRKYNTDDVIIVQHQETRGYVYLILTGYCDVVQHDGQNFNTIASLQAGDVIGEMAVVTGVGTRNASVVARTPVTVCVFGEETFAAFVKSEGFQGTLLNRWAVRPFVRQLPQFTDMTSTALEKVSIAAEFIQTNPGESLELSDGAWMILAEGTVAEGGQIHEAGTEFGWRPFAEERCVTVETRELCKFVKFTRESLEQLRLEVPQVNYYLRKQRVSQNSGQVNWLLGDVKIS